MFFSELIKKVYDRDSFAHPYYSVKTFFRKRKVWILSGFSNELELQHFRAATTQSRFVPYFNDSCHTGFRLIIVLSLSLDYAQKVINKGRELPLLDICIWNNTKYLRMCLKQTHP